MGLYVESTETNASYDIHVDNVRINRYVEVNPEASQCEGYDYEGEGFYITYDNLEPGENEFQRMVFSNTSAIADSVVNLTVAVTAMPTDTIEATTCEGEPYENYGFEVAAGESGEFKRKLKSEETGCDSVAVLKLNIIGTLRVQLMDTICQGQTYTFGGQELNRTGIYVDTVASQSDALRQHHHLGTYRAGCLAHYPDGCGLLRRAVHLRRADLDGERHVCGYAPNGCGLRQHRDTESHRARRNTAHPHLRLCMPG